MSEFPAAWPYAYSGGTVPGGGVIQPDGTILWPIPGSNPEETFIRYVHHDGSGLMNNDSLDRMLLTDDEENELMERLDFGLQQPPGIRGNGVPSEAIFAFTPEGEQKHQRLLELLSKASTQGGVVRNVLDPAEYEVIWTSTDGQVALIPKGANPEEWVQMQQPEVVRETAKSRLVRWECPLKVEWIPDSQAKWEDWDQRLYINRSFVKWKKLERWTMEPNPYEEEEEIIYGANPDYTEQQARGQVYKYRPSAVAGRKWRYDPAYPIAEFPERWKQRMLDWWRDEEFSEFARGYIANHWALNPSIEPIIFVKTEQGMSFIDGQHRLGYAIEHGWETIPAVIGTPIPKSEEPEEPKPWWRRALGGNPYEEEEEQIHFNPTYPTEEQLDDYEGVKVRYEPETMPDWERFEGPDDIRRFAESRGMLDDTRERVYAIYTDQSNRARGYHLVSAGGLSAALSDPRQVFSPVIALNMAGVIILHNHPSGQLKPSPNDLSLVRKLKKSADILGVRFLDFVIVSREGVWSANDDGLILY